MDEKRRPNRAGKKISLFLFLTCLTALGSLAWNWVFPETGPTAVQAAAGQTAGTAAASATVPETTSANAREKFPIYLVGAVKKPGIYMVESGSYLYELVRQAGGLLPEAAADRVNLAFRLENNQLIRIPTRAEAAADPNQAADMGDGLTSAGLIDLNTAGQEELDKLPGVGPSTARAILDYRSKNGSFQRIEDLMKVPGIKESRFSQIRDLVIVRNRS